MTHVTPQRLLPKRSSGESKFFCTLCAWCFSPAHASVQCKNGAKFATVQHGVWYMIPCDHDHREHWCKDLQHLQLIQHSFQFPSPDARSFAIQEKKQNQHWIIDQAELQLCANPGLMCFHLHNVYNMCPSNNCCKIHRNLNQFQLIHQTNRISASLASQ